MGSVEATATTCSISLVTSSSSSTVQTEVLPPSLAVTTAVTLQLPHSSTVTTPHCSAVNMPPNLTVKMPPNSAVTTVPSSAMMTAASLTMTTPVTLPLVTPHSSTLMTSISSSWAAMTPVTLTPPTLPIVTSTVVTPSASLRSFPFVPSSTSTTTTNPDLFSSLVSEVEEMTSPQADRVLDQLKSMYGDTWDPYDELAFCDSGIYLLHQRVVITVIYHRF